jgi:hypothetical protein
MSMQFDLKCSVVTSKLDIPAVIISWKKYVDLETIQEDFFG